MQNMCRLSTTLLDLNPQLNGAGERYQPQCHRDRGERRTAPSLRSILSSSLFVVSLMAQTPPSGKYIITLADGGMALDADAPGMSLNDGKIHLWQNTGGGPTQVWAVRSVGGDVYTIVLAATGMALDADGPGMHTNDGIVHLWTYNGGKTQRWRIRATGNNTYAMILEDGGKALDAGVGSMHENDGIIHLWDANLGKTQKWAFRLVEAFPEFDEITRTSPNPQTDPPTRVIRIDRPNPKQRKTEYPQITFKPGDNVTIHAGGCVQSGGTGATWHRYVNPSGGDADRFFHGLITIPFATGVLDRIQKYWNKTVHILDTADPSKLHLQLGFEDESDNAYGDNGYWGHDDGPGGQCRGADGQEAWVELVIVPGPLGTLTSKTDWNLVFSQFDDNVIPLNPDWQSYVSKKQLPDENGCRWPWQGGGAPNCADTGQITNTDFASSFDRKNPADALSCRSCELCAVFSANHDFGGHANWMPATHTGTVIWEEHATHVLDDEYSVNLSTPNAAGATVRRTEGIHVEFDSEETIDILTDDFKIPWWQQFRSAVDGGDEQAHSFLDNRFMIVTGLMAVDFAHAPVGAESHPAWALAIHANEDFADDTWAFFVRNWGNEGFCSTDQHYVDYFDNQYTFRFPWPNGATSGVVKSNIVATNAPSERAPQIEVSFIPGQAVLLTFRGLRAPEDKRLIGGELHLTWSGTPVPVAARITSVSQVRTPPEPAVEAIRSAHARMTPAQRAVYMANAPKTSRTVGPALKLNVQTVPATQARLAPRPVPRVRAIRDEGSVARKSAEIEALKKAYGGTIPLP